MPPALRIGRNIQSVDLRRLVSHVTTKQPFDVTWRQHIPALAVTDIETSVQTSSSWSELKSRSLVLLYASFIGNYREPSSVFSPIIHDQFNTPFLAMFHDFSANKKSSDRVDDSHTWWHTNDSSEPINNKKDPVVSIYTYKTWILWANTSGGLFIGYMSKRIFNEDFKYVICLALPSVYVLRYSVYVTKNLEDLSS